MRETQLCGMEGENTMKRSLTRQLRKAIFTSTGLALLATTPAFAQGADDDANSGTIIVTAQKREQDIQDVPISMTVVGGQQLSDFGIKDFNELDRFVPNFYVQTTPGNNAFYIRGIGSTPGNLAFEQTVGLFVDGVYGGHARQFQVPFLDVERIEVLRGPQGALVGKNTSAGAISVVSAKPTRDFQASVEASREFEIGGTRGFAVVSGPLSSALSARGAFLYEKNDGYIRNTGTVGGDDGERKSWFGRASFLIDAGGPLDVSFKIEGGKVDLTGSAVERLEAPTDPDLIRTTNGYPGFVGRDFDNTDNVNAVMTANLDLGDHVLTSISGYSKYKFRKRLDSDFGPANGIASGFEEDFDQISQEIRLVSPTTKPLEYIVGAYYHKNDYDYASQTRTVAYGERFFVQNNHVWSLFGSATYKMGDAVRVTGSLRYTNEKKDATQRTLNNGALLRTLVGDLKETEWDPSVNVQWFATSDVMLYASWGEGSKAGGFIGGQATTLQSQFKLNSESSTTLEAGAKLTALDRRLTFNIAAFRTRFRDLQTSSFDATLAAFITLNAGRAQSKGIEADARFEVTDGITLTGSLARLNATYLDFPGAPCLYSNTACITGTAAVRAANNAAGLPIPRSPKWSGTLGLDIVQPFSDTIEMFGNGGMTFRSRAFLEDSYNPVAAQEGHSKLDARIGLRAVDDAWEVALVGKNLTNKLTASHAFNTPTVAGLISQYIQPPRTFALQVKLSF